MLAFRRYLRPNAAQIRLAETNSAGATWEGKQFHGSRYQTNDWAI